MHVYLIAAAAVWGGVSGLLLPRAAYRLAVEPEQPWAGACPAGHPVGGWLGPARCRACARPAGGAAATVDATAAEDVAAPVRADGRYGPGPVLALACALACAALAHAVGARPELGVWLLLAPAGLLLARVDLLVFRLPDVLTLPAAAGAALLLGLAALLPRHDGSWTRALIAAAALGVLYLVLFLVNPVGMGFGDVKLAPTLGLALGWYGWQAVFLGTFAGFLLGALTGLVLLLTRRANRKSPIPFGPFMLLGAFGAVLLAA
ncbi:A24 family peptidase [Streptomyces sp. V4-01]|uniref:A24 family peptidase n=1 Tax=Actinacidiphila polyblastidii TaxID=3110430 RepID=A0ABU7PCK4_9ACTN|nr:A24 family peptidase [Streptomyces sp. V4-01]